MVGSTRTLSLTLVLALSALSGCAIFWPTDKSGDTATGTSSSDGGTTDAGTSGDAGGGDAGGGDGGGGDGGGGDAGGGDAGGGDAGGGDAGSTDAICKQVVNTGPPADACVTDTLSCGDSIVDTLVGGQATFGAEAYQNWFCGFGDGTGYDPWAGNERVYSFTHPGGGTATITLDSPCIEADLVAVRWSYFVSSDECPGSSETLISECEMDDSSGGGTVSIWNSDPTDYLVIVDGVDNAKDNFGISVACP